MIKNVFDNRIILHGNFFNFNVIKKDHYKEGTSLSQILKDLKTDYYINARTDSVYLTRLLMLIVEQDQRNPFEKLESYQKNDFENLRYKSKDEYKLIQSDVNRIVDELHNKNILVEKYLNKSNSSFQISIYALAISILFGAVQIWLAYHFNKKKPPKDLPLNQWEVM